MLSAEYSCKLFKPIFAYRQTVLLLIRLLLEQSDLGPQCLQKFLLKSQADGKADDNCCDWRYELTPYHFSKILTSPFLSSVDVAKIAKWKANSVDPDQLLHSAAADLSLNCLLRPVSPKLIYAVLVFCLTISQNIKKVLYINTKLSIEIIGESEHGGMFTLNIQTDKAK